MKPKRIRKRRWGADELDAVTRERRRHRGRDSGASPEETGPREYFSDIEPNAVVVSPYGALAFVETSGLEVLCRVARELMAGKSSILAPGDRVLVEFDAEGACVRAVAKRRNKLSRPEVGAAPQSGGREQVLAANLDLLVVVASTAQPPFKPGLIDRCLIAAEVGGVPFLLCVNKMDLVTNEPAEVGLYRELGIPVVNASCVTGQGLEDLRGWLRGKQTCLTGHSGVGKSSLINALDPRYDIATRSISESTKKGRHTTCTSRLYHLADGIHIIDTPGIRQLGLWGVSREEFDFYFPEINALSVECRFRDCTHVHEPRCAVLEAVASGAIPKARYNSYLRIRASL